jgi:hypothetical protein
VFRVIFIASFSPLHARSDAQLDNSSISDREAWKLSPAIISLSLLIVQKLIKRNDVPLAPLVRINPRHCRHNVAVVAAVVVWIIHTDSRIIHLSRRKRNYDGRAAAMLKSASRRNAEADTATHRIKAV